MSNAYTSMENTNYYFDIKQEHLSGALDRFAQFFIEPLFNEVPPPPPPQVHTHGALCALRATATRPLSTLGCWVDFKDVAAFRRARPTAS